MSDISVNPAALTAPATAGDYFALLKPRVMTLVVFTGVVGLSLAPGQLHPILALTAILALAVGAGASGAINMWYERDVDVLMHRTRGRPLPRGKIAPEEALTFGVVLSLFAVMLMGLAANWVAAFWLAFASAFYVFVYTIGLKRRTPQNIVIGGAAGAFPPVIGWAAVTGSAPLEAWLMFALIFFWTPPHFWALALYRSDDYARAGIPMLPVVKGKRHTKWQMLAYTLVLLPLALAPVFIGLSGLVYGAVALLMSLLFIGHALRVLRSEGDSAPRAMFFFSIFYLFALFAALWADHLVKVWL
jgi:protoheme IX farnesyltransferase